MKRENRKNPVKILKHAIFMFKTAAISMFLGALQVRHVLKKRRQISIMLVISAFFILNVFLFNTIGGQLLSATSLQSHGTVETIGVAAYTESSCVTAMSTVDWGKVKPGSYSTNTVYIRNEGNSDVMLSLNAVNWNPAGAGNYMTLSWNYGGQTLQPNQVVQLTLTLSVSQNIDGIESFYFDIIIMGTN